MTTTELDVAIETSIDTTSEASLQPTTLVCDGNEASAWGIALARPDIIAIYPITPQSSLVEYLAQFVAEGAKAQLIAIDADGNVSDADWTAINAAHAIIFGSPTYMGMAS